MVHYLLFQYMLCTLGCSRIYYDYLTLLKNDYELFLLKNYLILEPLLDEAVVLLRCIPATLQCIF